MIGSIFKMEKFIVNSAKRLHISKFRYISSDFFSNVRLQKKSDESGFLPEPKGFASTAIHAFQDPEQWDSLPVVTPLVTSSTFKQHGPGGIKKYQYGRTGNPNRELLEKCLAALENGKYALCWSSGLGSITAAVNLLKAGDHIVSGDVIYGGTHRIFTNVCARNGIETTFAKQKNMECAIKENTKLIWVEGLTNPTLTVSDIPGIAALAHEHEILLGVDNTFLSPYCTRPLDLGADIVVHSLTKYINGHSDVIMGVTITNNKDIYEKLKYLQNTMGIVPAPFDCYQVTRSIKTLAVRMRQHMKNSLEVAKFLQSHPKIEKVLHPGLPSHPQHELFKKIASGCSGMTSFYLKDPKLEKSRKFLSSLKMFAVAESLGGYESLAQLPVLMTHAAVPEEERKKVNITDNLIRLSIGLEDVEDIIKDLKQALEKI